MENLVSDSESDDGFRINEGYAEKYNKWRQKEELQKLKDKYGDDESSSSDESSSESEDEDAEALTEKLDKEWLQTLTALKRKDPKIYDKNTAFYASNDSSDENSAKINHKSKKIKDKKDKPYFLKDYERDLIVKKGGVINEDESDDRRKLSRNYYEEQDEIKKSLKSAAKEIDESDSEDEFLTKRKITQADREKEDEEYDEWIKGQKPVEEKLVGIDPWNKPNLTKDEQFLRDYILNKKYVNESDNEDAIPTYDEIVNVDEEEEELDKQETFERKYNFRYEDPDQEFIKTYPRTVGESVRRKDDRRARKRQETRERKKREKEKKREELKQLKNLKKQEIMDKIDLIKEVTGNTDIGFAPEDIEGDFDPEKYDRMMKDAFTDDYYDEATDEVKPTFDKDEEYGLDVDNWDDWVPEGGQCDGEEAWNDNMGDAEGENWYKGHEMLSKKQRRKSKFAKAVAKRKPMFDPNDKTFEEYLDEYYKLDYEDLIGDQPCRFKYRSVVPNDFGLTTGDVLKAGDKELNQWVSVKKMSQYRTREEEMYDVKIFQKRSKRKGNVLMSLEGEKAVPGKTRQGNFSERKQKKGRKETFTSENQKGKKRKAESSTSRDENKQSGGGFVKRQKLSEELNRVVDKSHSNKDKNIVTKKKPKRGKRKGQRDKAAMSDERLKAYGINPKKFKHTKAKYMKK